MRMHSRPNTSKLRRERPSQRAQRRADQTHDGELVKGGQAGQQRRCHGGVTVPEQELVVRVVFVTVGEGIGTTEKHQAVQECLRLNLTPHRKLDVQPHASPILVPLALSHFGA